MKAFICITTNHARPVSRVEKCVSEVMEQFRGRGILSGPEIVFLVKQKYLDNNFDLSCGGEEEDITQEIVYDVLRQMQITFRLKDVIINNPQQKMY